MHTVIALTLKVHAVVLKRKTSFEMRDFYVSQTQV